MSFPGWLEYGDRGPIIGRWPVEIVRAPAPLEPGDRVLIENGLIRRARNLEYGAILPEGARIAGNLMKVPEWWWYLHFGERLKAEPPRECCGDAYISTEPCFDCPIHGEREVDEPEFDLRMPPNE